MSSRSDRIRTALLGCAFAAILAPALASAQTAQTSYPPTVGTATMPPATPGVREFYVATVHLDGTTSTKGDAQHPPEAFPETASLPAGGGYVLTKPDANGTWNMRTFLFSPAQVTVMQGDKVVLNFIGVQGVSHRIQVEGAGAPVQLKRGEVARVEFVASQPGIVRYMSLDRQPSMQGEVLVLPKP